MDVKTTDRISEAWICGNWLAGVAYHFTRGFKLSENNAIKSEMIKRHISVLSGVLQSSEKRLRRKDSNFLQNKQK